MLPLLDSPTLCNVCASERLKPLRVLGNRKRRLVDLDQLILLGCRSCGMTFVHPLPSEEALDAHYASGGWDKVAGRSSDALERRVARKRARAGRNLDALTPHLPDSTDDGRPPRVLDFGCGSGEWLDALADRGWETWGIEPAPGPRAVAARRHRMVDEPPSDESFDLLGLNHVLEHLREPRTVLEGLARSIRLGGIMFASVPNLGTVGEHGDVTYVANSLHVSSYTSAGMASLVGLCGFELLEAPSRAMTADEPKRLKCVARRTGTVAAPEGEPIAEAEHALREHAVRARSAAAKDASAEEGEAETGDRAARALGKRLLRAVDP